MPLLLLLADAPAPTLHARITAALQLGAPLQIAAVLLGDWPPGNTLHLQSDGATDPAAAVDDRAIPDRISVLDITTTVTLLGVLGEAHTGTQPPPSTTPTAPAPATTPNPAMTPSPETDADADAEPAATPTPAASSPTDEPPNTTADTESQPGAPGTADDARATAPGPEQTRSPARIRALGGAPTLESPTGEPIKGFRTNALQLLALLVTHRAGMELPAIMEAIAPDALVKRASEQLSTNAANVRNRIRTALGDPKNTELKPVLNTGGHYQLHPTLVIVDWWDLQDAVAEAATTTDPQLRGTLLRRAVDTWTGPLLEGCDYNWAEPVREYSRRLAITAHLRLAELLTDTDPTEAATLLEDACAIDPLNEELARLAMHANARTGNTTALRRRLQILTAALNDIDTEPDETTTELAEGLLRDTNVRPLPSRRPTDSPHRDTPPKRRPDGPGPHGRHHPADPQA